jgi:uncharacterized protein YacL
MNRTAGAGVGVGALRLAGAALAAALGAAGAALLVLALRDGDSGRVAVLAALGASSLALSGLSAGAAALSAIGAIGPTAASSRQPADAGRPAPGGSAVPKILDTNVIIDGRIADVCETGLLEGPLIVPQFVLRELQYIADSSDPLKRNRGRRGLDVLSRMQKRADPAIVVSDRDFPLLREVDAKLVALARETGGLIVTNDVNLNKVAEVSGAAVLNLNQLANALKPVALPGEIMRVSVIKEGKEPNQGVGYLDDGTMVVVDNARRLIGRSAEVSVTSSIQTSAGRMIFAQLRETAREAAATGAEAAP